MSIATLTRRIERIAAIKKKTGPVYLPVVLYSAGETPSGPGVYLPRKDTLK